MTVPAGFAGRASGAAPRRDLLCPIVDGHVHFHRCFDAAAFWGALRANFAAAAHRLGLGKESPGMAVFADMAGEDSFAALRDGDRVPPGWDVERPLEAEAAIMRHEYGGRAIVAVAGRQIRTREGIEALAVATRGVWPDGIGLAELLDALAAEGVPAVLPWGAGKWAGRRGRIVAAAFAARPGALVFAGDNAGRPWGWRFPVRCAAGRPVLPGSDPLPLRGCVSDAGRYGFVLAGPCDMGRPAAFLRTRLAELDRPPCRFGGRVGPLQFAVRQARLRTP